MLVISKLDFTEFERRQMRIIHKVCFLLRYNYFSRIFCFLEQTIMKLLVENYLCSSQTPMHPSKRRILNTKFYKQTYLWNFSGWNIERFSKNPFHYNHFLIILDWKIRELKIYILFYSILILKVIERNSTCISNFLVTF